jgi:uncharacterized membrane protein (UPF0182 family)
MTWLDRLLEELQRRQQEADAQREGRPIPRRDSAPRDRTPRDAGRGGPSGSGAARGNGAEDDWEGRFERPTPVSGRRRGGPRGSGGSGGTGGGSPFGGPVAGGDWGQYRRWIVIGLIVFAALVVLFLLSGAVGLITDVMWYDAIDRRSILTTRLFSQLALFAIGWAAFFVPALISIIAARRIAPRVPVRRLGSLEMPDVSRAVTIGLAVLAGFIGLISAGAWSGIWETVLLWFNGADFGQTDPHFGRDIGFYIFDLPFLRFVQGWAIAALIVIILLTLGVYAAGAMKWQLRLTAPVRAHLSILGALLLIAIAAGYQLDIADLSYSTRGVDGTLQAATYTDLNAQVPAYVILTGVALVAALLMLGNIFARTLWLLALAGGAWLVLSFLVGGLYPTFVQRFTVEPNELNVERPYIADHIAATRSAFELDTIEERQFSGEAPLSRELFDDNAATLANLRLWDYRPLLQTFGQAQIIRRYYDFTDVDIDRYEIDGEQRQLMLSARELNTQLLDDAAKTWTNERLVYTHGFGLTAVPVNAVTSDGEPRYLVSGINRNPDLPIGEPRLYFGEVDNGYQVVRTTTNEFDYPLSDASEDDARTTWNGQTGVSLGNPFARILFALRFGDLNLFISDQMTDDSQILFRRTLSERVQELAPFLVYDHDPYIVSADGRLTWIWDAYTVSNRYPNAQPLADVFPGANYVRNAVKVTVDAYDGSVHFYIADESDPIIAAYAQIFDGMFESMDAMPDELREHVRYPEDLFLAQTESYLLYHVQPDDRGAGTFYNREDVWAMPEVSAQESAGGAVPSEPYYVIMQIPGESEGEFVLIQPMVAANRPNMIAWVAARNDGEHYGQRIAFRFPTDSSTLGPVQVQARIEQDDTISAQFALWDRSGARVIRGNLIVLPMGDSLLYMEPIFLQSEQARFPEFVRVIFVSQNRVAFAETVEDGLAQILGEEAVPPPVEEPPGEEPGGGGGELPSDVAGLVARAQQLYDEAQTALEDGDLGRYQDRIDELASVLEALAELTGVPVESLAPSPAASPGG